MSEQIDWSKAPKWATHALEKLHEPDRNLVYWSFFVDGEHRVEPNGLWYHPDRYRVIQSRPTTPSWSGEGLPPVGVVCEFKSPSSGGWLKARIIFVSAWTVVLYVFFEHDEHYYSVSAFEKGNLQFRPVRTPEQIAADDRSKGVDEMVKALGMDEPGTAEYIRCGLIYDAGFRKP